RAGLPGASRRNGAKVGIMKSQHVRVSVGLAAAIACAVPASAQSLSYSSAIVKAGYQLSGPTLSWEVTRTIVGTGNPASVLESHGSLNVADLDLDRAKFYDGYDANGTAFVGLEIECKGSAACYSDTSSYTTTDRQLAYRNRSEPASAIQFWCPS